MQVRENRMGHGVGTNVKPLRNQGSNIRGSEGRLSVFTKDGDIEGSSDPRFSKHFGEPEILRIAVVPAGHYDRLFYHGKRRRPSRSGARRDTLSPPRGNAARFESSFGLIPKATPPSKETRTA